MALFVRDIISACFCRISQHLQVYSSTTEYQRTSLTILPTENYNLPSMGHKIPYLSSLLVTCHQSSRLYGVFMSPSQISQGNISLRCCSVPITIKLNGFSQQGRLDGNDVSVYCHKSPDWRQMAIENTPCSYFCSAFVDS